VRGDKERGDRVSDDKVRGDKETDKVRSFIKKESTLLALIDVKSS